MKKLKYLAEKYLFSVPHLPVQIPWKPLRILVLICGWAAMLLLPVYTLVSVEYIHFASKSKVFTFFTEHVPVVLFDIALLYLLWLCLLSLLKKGWIAALCLSIAAGLFAFTDYMKYAMTGDYFYPWDIVQQGGKIGELTKFLTVPFPVLYIFLIAFGILCAVPIFFSGAELPLRWNVRYPVLLLTVFLCYSSVSTPQKVQELLNKNSLYLEDMALQTSNYQANGFIGAFTVNLLSSNIQKPDDYSFETVSALLDGYQDEDAGEDFQSPDIILILSESFWDPTLLPGTEFSEDPVPNYHALTEDETVISGSFYTTGFGGGTVRPEFEVLTGLSTDHLPSGCVPWQYVTKEMESYVSLYRNLGYTTMAVHPYTSSFYSRKSAYPLIGIDILHFEDDIYALGKEGTLNLTIRGKQISDDTFRDAIEYYLEGVDGTPTFLFGISMENHQPYTDKFDPHWITVTNSAFDESTANAVENYTQGVNDADRALGDLAEYVRSRERPTILIWFGDHLPTLGTNYAAYTQSGLLADYTEEEYESIYSTPFVIVSNFELDESTLLHIGSGNKIASYNLMNAVSQLISSPRTAYMNWLEDYGAEVPYYNIRLHRKLTDDESSWVSAHTTLTYDRVAGNGWSFTEEN